MLTECPLHWKLFRGNCYNVTRELEGLTWQDAKTRCEIRNSHLAHIKSRSVTIFIHDYLMQERVVSYTVYIGEHYMELIILLSHGAGNKRPYSVLLLLRICINKWYMCDDSTCLPTDWYNYDIYPEHLSAVAKLLLKANKLCSDGFSLCFWRGGHRDIFLKSRD